MISILISIIINILNYLKLVIWNLVRIFSRRKGEQKLEKQRRINNKKTNRWNVISQKKLNLFNKDLKRKIPIEKMGNSKRCWRFIHPWKANILDLNINSEDKFRLLIFQSIARILCKDYHCCCCLRFVRGEKIQVAFNSSSNSQEYSKVIKILQSLDNKKSRRELIILAIKKDCDLLESKAFNFDISKIFPNNSLEKKLLDNLKKSVPDFKKSLLQLDNKSQKSYYLVKDKTVLQKKLKKEMQKFLEDSWNYFSFLRDKCKKKDVISQLSLLPFLNLYDVISILRLNAEGGRIWKNIEESIKYQGFKIIGSNYNLHAEMKMLEANIFNEINIFAEEPCQTVITKKPCIHCWVFACSCSKDDSQRDAISRNFGCLGFTYWDWNSPTCKDKNRINEISLKYNQITKQIIRNKKERFSLNDTLINNNNYANYEKEKELEKDIIEIVGTSVKNTLVSSQFESIFEISSSYLNDIF